MTPRHKIERNVMFSGKKSPPQNVRDAHTKINL
jgi:hypothetical protein